MFLIAVIAGRFSILTGTCQRYNEGVTSILQEMIGDYESDYFHVNGLILESQKR